VALFNYFEFGFLFYYFESGREHGHHDGATCVFNGVTGARTITITMEVRFWVVFILLYFG
jgi:hypothetical protein